MRVAQVTARLGETIVDLAHIAPGERYTIGTAPGVHFVVPGVGELPLVTREPRGFVVRRPIGLGAFAVDGRPASDAAVVLGWTRITFTHELVSLTIELVERAPIPVPRPAFDLRPIAYLAASLMIQLGIVVSAIGVGRPPRVKKPRPRIQAHPRLQDLRRFMLGTRDAHGLYAQFGFEPVKSPERFMEIAKPIPNKTIDGNAEAKV